MTYVLSSIVFLLVLCFQTTNASATTFRTVLTVDDSGKSNIGFRSEVIGGDVTEWTPQELLPPGSFPDPFLLDATRPDLIMVTYFDPFGFDLPPIDPIKTFFLAEPGSTGPVSNFIISEALSFFSEFESGFGTITLRSLTPGRTLGSISPDARAADVVVETGLDWFGDQFAGFPPEPDLDNSNIGGLHVVVAHASSLIPEPGSVWLLGSGLGFLVCSQHILRMHRRAKRRVAGSS